jgi:hypothetical protein
MEAHWPMNSPLARHAAAADLWMELTGRKSAAVLELAKEAMEKRANGDMVAEPKPASKAPVIGAGVGGVAGAGLLGTAAHQLNKTRSVATRIPRHLAALGGGTIGAGIGATAGVGYLVHKALKAPPEVKQASWAGAIGGATVGAGLGALAGGEGNRMKGALVGAGAGGLGGAAAAHLAKAPLDRSIRAGAPDFIRREHAAGRQVKNIRQIRQTANSLGQGAVGVGTGAVVGAATGYATAGSAKTGSAASPILEYLRSHPRAASTVGAALLAAPAAAGGYLHEKARHTPGAGGKSSFEIDNEQALAGYRARAEHSGKPSVEGKPSLREKYLLLKERAGHEGSADPRRAAAIGAIPYAGLAAMTGATMAPRLLRW